MNKYKFRVKVISMLLAGIFLCMPVFAQKSDLNDLKQQADALSSQQKHLEALPILERIILEDPKDAKAQYQYGFACITKATVVLRNNKTEAMKYRLLAKNAFLESIKLGNKEPLAKALAESISDDGSSKGKFSLNPEAEEAMRAAEEAFAKRDMNEAFKNYQKAIDLDPMIYEAALFSGDVFLQKGEFDKAEVWYQKAIKINPFRETAYRYSATPFMRQQKYDIARDRYIEAFISEPFNRFSAVGISQWAEVTGHKLGHPRIDIPTSVGKGENGNINITLNLNDKEDDGSFVWTMYGLSRALWQSGKDGALSDKFKAAYPNEKVYRHSLAEEYDTLKMCVVSLKEAGGDKKKSIKKLNPQLEKLVEIYDKGLLEPYILLAMADNGIFQDYDPYLEKNRDKLRKYVLEYVIRK